MNRELTFLRHPSKRYNYQWSKRLHKYPKAPSQKRDQIITSYGIDFLGFKKILHCNTKPIPIAWCKWKGNRQLFQLFAIFERGCNIFYFLKSEIVLQIWVNSSFTLHKTTGMNFCLNFELLAGSSIWVVLRFLRGDGEKNQTPGEGVTIGCPNNHLVSRW